MSVLNLHGVCLRPGTLNCRRLGYMRPRHVVPGNAAYLCRNSAGFTTKPKKAHQPHGEYTRTARQRGQNFNAHLYVLHTRDPRNVHQSSHVDTLLRNLTYRFFSSLPGATSSIVNHTPATDKPSSGCMPRTGSTRLQRNRIVFLASRRRERRKGSGDDSLLFPCDTKKKNDARNESSSLV